MFTGLQIHGVYHLLEVPIQRLTEDGLHYNIVQSFHQVIILTPSDFLFRNQNVPPGDAILNPESIFCYSP